MSAASDLLDRLAERGWTLGVAESLTGGLVIAELVAVPGASATVRGGVIAYATDVKHRLLGVDPELLAAEGAVHPEVARQMAQGVRAAVGTTDAAADVGIATTGVAGPDGQDGQPVGTVFIAVATPHRDSVVGLHLSGGRREIREEAARRAIALALDAV